MSLWNAVCSVLLCNSVRKRNIFYERKYHRVFPTKILISGIRTLNIQTDSMRDWRWLRHILWGISSGKNHHEDRLETRRGPSMFKNMPFKGQEDALLEARRACSQTLFITRWFIVGYISAFSRLFPPIVRALNANIYTGSLPSERCSSSTAFTANISRDTHSLCWQKTIMNSQQYEIIIRNVYTTAQYL